MMLSWKKKINGKLLSFLGILYELQKYFNIFFINSKVISHILSFVKHHFPLTLKR